MSQYQDTDPSEGLSAEEQLLADNAAIIDEMRSKYDDIAIYPAPKGFDGVVIIAPPANPKVFQNFANNLNSGKADVAVETINFALACVVHPDRATAKAIFAKKVPFAFKLASRAQELAGGEAKELGKD